MSNYYCYHCELKIKSKNKVLGPLEWPLADLIAQDAAHFPHPWQAANWTQLTAPAAPGEIMIAGLSDSQQNLAAAGVYLVNSADSFAHLVKIWTMPAFKRQGLALFLLREMERALKREEIKHFFLEVESSNLPAIKLYQQLGYQKIHFTRNFYGNGKDADIMERRD